MDFGTTVADGQVFTKEIAILNHGTKCGDFKIFANPALPFHFMPADGTVNPGYSQPIRVILLLSILLFITFLYLAYHRCVYLCVCMYMCVCR